MPNEVPNLIQRLPRLDFQFQVPFIPTLPTMPFVGCFSGLGKLYTGKKHHERPDMKILDHIKQYKKDFEEKILHAEVTKLDNPARAAAANLLKVKWIAEVAEAIDKFTETVAEVNEELNEAIGDINARVAELNAARQEILNTPAETQSLIQQHLLQLYDDCAGKLDAQRSRLQGVLACLGAF